MWWTFFKYTTIFYKCKINIFWYTVIIFQIHYFFYKCKINIFWYTMFFLELHDGRPNPRRHLRLRVLGTTPHAPHRGRWARGVRAPPRACALLADSRIMRFSATSSGPARCLVTAAASARSASTTPPPWGARPLRLAREVLRLLLRLFSPPEKIFRFCCCLLNIWAIFLWFNSEIR